MVFDFHSRRLKFWLKLQQPLYFSELERTSSFPSGFVYEQKDEPFPIKYIICSFGIIVPGSSRYNFCVFTRPSDGCSVVCLPIVTMIPEQPHVARRSASHGALSSSYAIQARISSESGHLLPPFRPLRSIREHTHTYLDPAASVEGMLRKTTETSNIGIFSIGRSNGLRSRPSLSDLRQPSQSFSRISARLPVQDDRKQLPSYRDSTSEIISMYGSENQSSKSVSGTLSPPWDDSGQRSYSMTTCGSRGYFTPLVNGIQPVSDFHLKGQRPRSPYPYPTRLARPGIRPSSPALTENGLVDYSRMVEIDRIPQVWASYLGYFRILC